MNRLHDWKIWEETSIEAGFSLSEVERFIADSFASGYNAKSKDVKKHMTALFNSNLKTSNQITLDVIQYLTGSHIQLISAYMKIESINNFSIIFTVNLEDYISEGILKAYEWSHNIEQKVRTPNFNIDLSFMHEDEILDISALNSDGYKFKYKN